MRRISPGVYENAQGRRVAPRGGFAPLNNQQKNFLKGAPQGNALAQRMPTGGGAQMAPMTGGQQMMSQPLDMSGMRTMDYRPGRDGPPLQNGMELAEAYAKSAPRSLGQNEMSGNWVHDQRANQMMMDRQMGGGAGMPSTMENRGAYGGFESNYFPEARMNMPLAPGGQSIQGAQPNMGMAQGNADNYFPEARMNMPQAPRPPMAGPGKIKQIQNPKGLLSAPPQSNGGMQRLSPGVYRDAKGRTVRR